METTPTLDRTPNADRPSLASECANVLLQRHLVTEKNLKQVVAILQEQAIVPEGATAKLLRAGFVAPENRAIASEFIKRTIQRFS
jgi:hypothetical protein